MKTEQINLRLEQDLLAALERVAREESLDRGMVIRRLLRTAIGRWQLDRALNLYQRGEASIGRAAEEAGLSQWEMLEAVRAAGIAYPLEPEEIDERLAALDETGMISFETLPDIAPIPGGVLLVGINPTPVSVAARHYYQGRLGKRLWGRLERVGLLVDALPGSEDEAFARAGHGLTDLVKRPSTSAAELTEEELRAGVAELREKVRRWQPGLILFPFKDSARVLLGASVRPGEGPLFKGTRTFLLSGPYAPSSETRRVDDELRRVIGAVGHQDPGEFEHSQPLRKSDLETGRIRFPRPAKRFFPPVRSDVEVVLEGNRVKGRYNPRTRENKSAVLHVGKAALRGLQPDKSLRISRGLGGIVRLD